MACNSITLLVGDSCTLWWDACNAQQWRMISCTVDVDTVTSPTATNGQTLISGSYTVTNAWANAGVSFNLPGAGTYKISCDATATIHMTAGSTGTIETRLWDTTAGALIVGTQRIAVNDPTGFGAPFTVCSSTNIIYTVTQATVVNLQAQWLASVAPTAANIVTDTIINYITESRKGKDTTSGGVYPRRPKSAGINPAARPGWVSFLWLDSVSSSRERWR